MKYQTNLMFKITTESKLPVGDEHTQLGYNIPSKEICCANAMTILISSKRQNKYS